MVTIAGRAVTALALPLLLACSSLGGDAGTPATGTPQPRASASSSAAIAGPAAADVNKVKLTWRRASTGLSAPTQVTSARDGTSRMFVVQKNTGTVRVFHNGQLRAKPYLNVGSLISTDSERGLLSLAFAPDFRSNPRLFIMYTRGDGDVVLARMRARSATAGHVVAGSRRTLLVVEHSQYGNHNGGQLVFGPDGMLYMGIGDGGGGGDPLGSGQSRSTLRGKILRLNVSCGKPYCVPRSNPFAGKTPGRGEIWLMGLRNPWKMSFDPATKSLWIGDVGQDGFEEVNRVRATPSHRNLGWSCREGRVVYNASRCRSGVRYVEPKTVVSHPAGESITGGYVYRGSRYSRLMGGLYVFGDFVNRKVWVYAPGQGKVLQAARLGSSSYNGPTSFGVDGSGEIWAVTYDGTLWRMRAQSR
jgi:glucose/arabinose dehydrogenase